MSRQTIKAIGQQPDYYNFQGHQVIISLPLWSSTGMMLELEREKAKTIRASNRTEECWYNKRNRNPRKGIARSDETRAGLRADWDDFERKESSEAKWGDKWQQYWFIEEIYEKLSSYTSYTSSFSGKFRRNRGRVRWRFVWLTRDNGKGMKFRWPARFQMSFHAAQASRRWRLQPLHNIDRDALLHTLRALYVCEHCAW